MAKKLSKKQITIYAVAALALLAVGAAAYVHNTRPKSTANTVTPTETPASKQDQGTNHPGQGSASGSGSSSGSTNSSSPSPTPQTDPQYNSSTLASPYGQAFGHNTILLDGSDQTKSPQEESSCNSVLGSTCDIWFTKDSTTIKLGAKAVDDNGTAIFDWNANSIGLTKGTWQVKFVASKSGQTSESPNYTLTVQ